MMKVIKQGVYYMEGRIVKESQAFMTSDKKETAVKNTISYGILSAHSHGMGETTQLKPDAVLLYDCRDVLRTADFIGMKAFPVPAYLFEGLFDGEFCRSAAEKWGGVYIPDGLAAMDAYAREQIAESGQLLFNTDGVCCGALGAMSFWVDEGDVLRCFNKTRMEDPCREVVAVYLKGKLRKGVGPTDVALAIAQALENAGDFAEGKVLEVFGTGVSGLSMDYRNAIDSALDSGAVSTVWATDEKTEEYFVTHLRGGAFKPLAPVQPAYYDGAVIVDLSDVEPMIALGNDIRTVAEFLGSAPESYRREGKVFLEAASVEYEAANYETMAEMAEILRDKRPAETGCGWLPCSKPVTLALSENGYMSVLLKAGVEFNALSNGASGLWGQDALVCNPETARLDARTIAATLACGGYLTSALGMDYPKRFKKYGFDPALYRSRVKNHIGKGQADLPLAYDGNIQPLPAFPALPADLVLSVNGGTGDLAVVLDEPESYVWSAAVEDRENGVCVALAKYFPERLRSHLIDWGILPLSYEKFSFKEGDVLHLENIAETVKTAEERFVAKVVGKRRSKDIVLTLGKLTAEERKTLLAGGKNNLVRGK